MLGRDRRVLKKVGPPQLIVPSHMGEDRQPFPSHKNMGLEKGGRQVSRSPLIPLRRRGGGGFGLVNGGPMKGFQGRAMVILKQNEETQGLGEEAVLGPSDPTWQVLLFVGICHKGSQKGSPLREIGTGEM